MRLPLRAILLAMTLPTLITAAALTGCAAQRLDTERARELATLPYPEEAQRGPELDIIARAAGNDLHLINREAQSYRDMQLWLNRQYVRRIDTVAIGRSNHWPLRSFINHFREPFPIGGLLSPEDREPVVLVELYDPDANVRYPLVTQAEGD